MQPFIESCGFDKNNFNIIRQWFCRTKYQQNQETIVQNLPGRNLPSQAPAAKNMSVNDISFWNNEFNFEQNFDFENFEEDIF